MRNHFLSRSLSTSYVSACCGLLQGCQSPGQPVTGVHLVFNSVWDTREGLSFLESLFLKYKISCSSYLLWFSLDRSWQYISDSPKSPVALWFYSFIVEYNIVLFLKNKNLFILCKACISQPMVFINFNLWQTVHSIRCFWKK